MIKRIEPYYRKILNILRQRKITKRTMILLIIIATLFISGSFIIYTKFLDYAIRTKLCNNMQVTVDQVKANLDYRLGQVSETGQAIWASLYTQVNSRSDIDTQLGEYRNILSLLTSYEGRYMIKTIQFNVPNEKIYSQQRDQIYPLNEITDSIYAQKAGTYWLETHQIKASHTSEYIDVISCVMSMTSKTDYRAIGGVLFLNVNVSDILKILRVEYQNSHLYLCGSDGKVIVSDNSSKLGEYAFSADQMEKINKLEAGYIDDGKDNVLIFNKLETTGWYLILNLNNSELSSYSSFEVKVIRVLYIVAILVIFVLLIIVAYIMIVKRTLDNINKSILDISPGNGSVLKEHTEHKKIGLPVNALYSLDSGVRNMVSATKTLMEEQYKTEIAAKEYQMQALQSQIKPHFLYNTLDSIKWLIKEHDIENSLSMLSDLSKYLRDSINRGLGHVTLHEEIELAKVYISIMRKRFTDDFSTEFLVNNEALKYYIPKLSLQPFIENALLHGILYCDKADKKITVRACVDMDILEIEIEDNGKGMNSEVHEQIAHQGTGDKKNYGINNVCKRLDLFSQGKYSFNIHSVEGIGTCVIIKLPLIHAQERKKYDTD